MIKFVPAGAMMAMSYDPIWRHLATVNPPIIASTARKYQHIILSRCVVHFRRCR